MAKTAREVLAGQRAECLGIPATRWEPDLVRDDVIYCALRFDGTEFDATLEREHPLGGAYGWLARLYEQEFAGRPWRLHPDPLVNWGVFFWLQRSHKWSGLDRPSARLMAWLFTQLHDQDPPRKYRDAEFTRLYDAIRPRAAELARDWAARLAEMNPIP